MIETVHHRIDALLKPSQWQGARALTIYAACASVLSLADDGDVVVAECGVAEGETAKGLRQLLDASGLDKVPLYLFDTFGTVPIAARNNLAAETVERHARSVHDVQAVVGVYDGGPAVGIVCCEPGLFKDTLPKFVRPTAFLHADGDLYESTCDIIAMADRCVVAGGVVVFDDYKTEWTGVTNAVDQKLDATRWFTYYVEGYGQLVAIRKG